jgi:predicted ATPase with chaperone activity
MEQSRTRKPLSEAAGTATSPPAPGDARPAEAFYPPMFEEWSETGMPEKLLEAMTLKYLFTVGEQSGRGVARALGLPPKPVLDILQILKNSQLAYYKDTAQASDFNYALSEAGRDRARKYLDECMYVGPMPVPFAYYVESVKAQSIALERPTVENVRGAFDDMLLAPHMQRRIGPAINSGRGLFLYGNPGNGKTSIAERITRCFGMNVWVPHAIYVSGEIIKFYDPQTHDRVELDRTAMRSNPHDERWVKIHRPTIVVGGELTMESLELQYNHFTKITEPSVQLKSNCGTLVIDDFGRQRMEPVELLNRWIVPLEKRFDFLTLSTGTKIQVPFDQLIIFSTNLEPRELVDDAFLRRIPYKINVTNPNEDEFRQIMRMMAEKFGIAYVENEVSTLIRKHYQGASRSFRCCHPRDLLLQIICYSTFHGQQPSMTEDAFDQAVENYFAVM